MAKTSTKQVTAEEQAIVEEQDAPKKGTLRLTIGAIVASGMLGQGRYTTLLRDDRMAKDLAVNALRVADALIAEANA